jgi:hypothetical protein
MSLYIGISAGLAVPLEMSNRINKQLYATMGSIDWSNFFGAGILDYNSGLAVVIVFVGMITSLMYFFFSKAHSGLMGGAAKFGIWILMIGFGANFGYTVMARISLFINRLQFLKQNWIVNAFDSTNKNYATFQLVFWFVVALLLAWIIVELVRALRRQPAA